MTTTVQTSADDAAASGSETIALWNPIAAALWSLLLTPAFGAWLHMRNWESLGEPDRARQARWWFAGLLVLALGGYTLAVAGALLGREDLSPPWWFGLLVFGVWCVLSAYPQISHIDDRHGEQYARRSWAAPVAIALAANFAIPFAGGVAMGLRAAAAY